MNRSCQIIFIIALFFTTTRAFTQDHTHDYLTQLSISELKGIKVITGSRVPERYIESIAAICVLPGETIRNADAASIADALRLAQGIQVGRFDANKWAVSSRGFNHIFSNKLLVLLDGRSLYTPIWSGVFWDSQDIYMEDISRIEVIRGPGATMWGSNAVNGVINIITKDTDETVGVVCNLGIGTEQTRSGFRLGGRINPAWRYRVYSKYQRWDNQVMRNGKDANDAWKQGMGGIRLDGHFEDNSHISFQLLGYLGRGTQSMLIPYPDPPIHRATNSRYKTSGWTALGVWERPVSHSHNIRLQAYLDFLNRSDPNIIAGDYRAIDLDFQHQWLLNSWNEMLWGVEYRYAEDQIPEKFALALLPEHRVYPLYSAFIQEHIRLFDNRLRFMTGVKLEHNEFSGFEYQPNIRAMWQIQPNHYLWGAIARAVRTPSRADQDSRFPYDITRIGLPENPGIMIAAMGSKKFKSEILLAHDLGYRFTIGKNLFVDLAAFYNQYDQLRSYEMELMSPIEATIINRDYIIIPYKQYNDEFGRIYGFELGLDGQLASTCQFHIAYSQLKMELDVKPASTYTGSAGHAGETPERQFTILSSFNLPIRHRLNVCVRYVDRVKELKIEPYVVTDINYRLPLTASLELSFSAQNLGYPHHAEFREGPIPFTSSEIQQSFFTNITWRQ